MDKQETLARSLVWLNKALVEQDPGRLGWEAEAALLLLRDLARLRDPLVLSVSCGRLFIQGCDVRMDSHAAETFCLGMTRAGIVSVLFHEHLTVEDLLLLLGVLRGEPWPHGALDDPEGPLGEGRAIRVFTATGVPT